MHDPLAVEAVAEGDRGRAPQAVEVVQIGVGAVDCLQPVGVSRDGDPRERVLERARADRQHRDPHRRGEVAGPEHERLERAGGGSRDPLHLGEAARRLDLHLQADALRQELRDRPDLPRRLDLRDDDDVRPADADRCEVVAPPLRAETVDADGERPERGRLAQPCARRLLLAGRDAVLEVDDDLVRREAGGLREHPRARSRHRETRPPRPCRHGCKPNRFLAHPKRTLDGAGVRSWHDVEEPDMRLIVTLTAALTVLFLVLPAHP